MELAENVVVSERTQTQGAKHNQSLNHMQAIEKESAGNVVNWEILRAVTKFGQKYATRWKGRHFPKPADLERFAKTA